MNSVIRNLKPKRIEVPYTPHPKQALFHSSPETEVLFGGSKGPGKTAALVMETLAYALEHPGATCYLFRTTYDDLEANLITEWIEKVPPELYEYKDSKHIAKLINGSKVLFRYIRNYKDAKKYKGRSIDFIGIDELTMFEEKWIQEVLSCLRSAKGFPTRFRATTNPGDIGHAWVKKRYVTSTDYGKKVAVDPVTGNTIKFIPATVYDNPILMKNDPNYVKRLENLPEAQKRAYLYGDWDAFEGMAFEKWNENIHVIEPFKIPKHWRRWIAVDNGYTDPFAWYWFAVDELGTVYVYREFTRDFDDPKIIYTKQAEKVLELSKYTEIENGQVIEEYEKIDYIVAGHDAWARHAATKTVNTPQGKSIIDYYNEGGLNQLAAFVKPITDRRLRKATILEYLEPFEDNEGNLTSKVKIFRTCKKLIETLPLLVNDPKDPEKYQEDSMIDHWADAFGYGLLSYHVEKSKKPRTKQNIILEHKDRLARSIRRKRKRLL
ncbi:MAG: hypothetical protein H0Z24_06805 [Thermosipho sp. (in: Bacteria)]|nr:hypothetical protein [Thermosipho sp. (in: thermotogales)]